MKESNAYVCEHICIESCEADWLEIFGIKVIREKVENLKLYIFNHRKNTIFCL